MRLLQVWAERFIEYLRIERRLSPHTLESYGRDLSAAIQWFEQRGMESWARRTQHHIRQ